MNPKAEPWAYPILAVIPMHPLYTTPRGHSLRIPAESDCCRTLASVLGVRPGHGYIHLLHAHLVLVQELT